MKLWRHYLEQYAEQDVSAQEQILVASYHSAEILGFLSRSLDREGRFKDIIDQRINYFRDASARAESFDDCLVNATFTIYNHMNTLCHQFAGGNASVDGLIRKVDEFVHSRVQEAGQLERSAAALRAAFPLLSLMTLVLGEGTPATAAIRQVEERFAAAAGEALTDRDHLLNALYRIVEMMQIFVALSDFQLKDQIQQIASVFKEEDETPDLELKMRNGFCRFFELAHLLTTHLDAIIP
jgi:hypothetical protein